MANDKRSPRRPGRFRRSIRVQGLVAITAPTIVVLAYVGVALWFTHTNQRAQSALVSAQRVLSSTSALQTDMFESQSAAAALLLASDPNQKAQYEAKYVASSSQIPKQLSQLSKYVERNATLQSMAVVLSSDSTSLQRDLTSLASQTVLPPDLYAAGTAISQIDNDDAHILTDLSSIQNQEDASTAAAGSQVNSSGAALDNIGAVGAALVVLGGLVLSLLFTSHIALRLRALGSATEALALGEPTGELPFGNDEIGRLGTQLAQAAALLRERENERDRARSDLDDVLVNSPVASFRYDTVSRTLTYASPNMEQMLNMKVAAALADVDSTLARFHPEDMAVISRSLRDPNLAPGDRIQTVVRFRLDDALEFNRFADMVITPHFDESGLLDSAVLYVVDITDRLQAERQADERLSLLESIFAASPDTITVRDSAGEVLVSSLLSTTEQEMSPMNHPELEAMLGRCLVGDTTADPVTASLGDNPGSPVYEMRARPVRGPGGRISGTVTVSRDITDRIRLEDSLRRASEAAERASQAKSDFLSRMSHELRTPLNAILGFAQLLELDHLPLHQAASVDQVQRAGRHLLSLINEVLDISLIEAGRLTVSPEAVGVADILGEVAALLAPAAESQGVTITVDTGDLGPRHVRADRQRLLQVLLNLGSNAIKYNKLGGHVDFRTFIVDQARIQFDVTDDGPGIPTDKMSQLFLPFSRLGAEQSNIEGTGVGLALSKQLTELMGGSISVESDPGLGSTFSVTLEITEAPGAESWEDWEEFGPTRSDVILETLQSGSTPGPGSMQTSSDSLDPTRTQLPVPSTPDQTNDDVQLQTHHRTVDAGTGSAAHGATFDLHAGDRDSTNKPKPPPHPTSSRGSVKPTPQTKADLFGGGQTPAFEPATPNNDLVVLYIEDNPSNAALVEQILSHRPRVSLIHASQAQAGIDQARLHHPHLVLLDLHLPDIPGDELIYRLKADPELSDIKIVVVSADATPSRIRRTLSLGIEGYLTKPIDVETLLRVIDAELDADAHESKIPTIGSVDDRP